MKKSSYFLIAIFFVILAIPTLDNIFQFSPVKELFEKRVLNSNPPFSLQGKIFKHYPKKFEDFYNDNYGFRKTLISINSQMLDKIFNQLPSNRVSSKDGWFYLDTNKEMIDVQGKVILDKKFLEERIDDLISNWQELKKNNINYLLVIPPNKSSIYHEFLPDEIIPKFGNKRLDQFLVVLKRKAPDFPVLDLRDAMFRAKAKEPHEIYYKTDTHWNTIGAHYGYLAIMNFLKEKYYPALKPMPRNSFMVTSKIKHDGDIANLMNLSIENDNEYSFQPKKPFSYSRLEITDDQKKQFQKSTFFTNKDKSLPVLFSYSDSFSGALMYFLPQHFSNAYFANEHHCKINLDIVKKYHPNIIIQEVIERKVQDFLETCKTDSTN
ncbi:MAG: hypothetical protein K0R25_376 [Rickettsiaceae bacterium]|jgi:hypothetical protein|nr:hypothetical protein [Rickettsiaceae bacterium]